MKKLEEGSERDAFDFFHHSGLRPEDLQGILMKRKPHIVHFCGHSSLKGKVILDTALGRGKQIDPKALIEVFSIFNSHVRVVVLNACLTDEQARGLSQVVDYAVGIETTIRDRAAIAFAGAFYLALSNKYSIPVAFKSAKAELRIQSMSHAEGIKLFARRSTPPPKPDLFDPEAMEQANRNHELKTALQSLFDDRASDSEKQMLRLATLKGTLILDQTGEPSDVGPEIVEGPDASGFGTVLRAEIDPASYGRIQERLFPPPPGVPPPSPKLIFVGREDSLSDVKRLLRARLGNRNDTDLTVIRGWPGVGKTVLVSVIGRDPDVMKLFPEGVLWTSLERKPELMSKMADWGRWLNTDELLRAATLDDAIVKLSALLRHRRMLLIVDDVWDAAHALPFLKAAAGSRCSVLATTRRPVVADVLTTDDSKTYLLPVLSESSSLELLGYLAPAAVKQHPAECRELVNDLGHLPLALHVAGRLLKAEARAGLNVVKLIESIRKGTQVLEEVAPIDRAEGTVLPTVRALLQKSTDALDDLTRDCFACLGPFAPKPATFDPEAMRAVWEVEDPLPIIRTLVGHGLLEPVGAGRFQMHELLVAHARSLLEQYAN